MPRIYDIRTPDGRIVTIRAETPEAAQRGAAEWVASNPKPKEDPKPEKPGGLVNLGLGMLENAAQGAGGFADAVLTNTGAKHITRWGEDMQERMGLPWADQARRDNARTYRAIESLRTADYGYTPGTSWADVKSNPLNIVPYGLETGLVSLPQMGMALANPFAYGLSLSDQIAHQRAANSGRTEIGTGDIAAALPFAAGAAALERFGARGILDDIAVKTLGQLPGGVAKAAVREGATEAGQEYLGITGEVLGTPAQEDFRLGPAFDRMASAGAAGLVFGGAAKGVTGTTSLATQDRQGQHDELIRQDLQDEADRLDANQLVLEGREEARVQALRDRTFTDEVARLQQAPLGLPAPQPNLQTPGLPDEVQARAQEVDRRAEVEPILVNMANIERQQIIQEQIEREPITPFKGERGYRYDRVQPDQFGPATNRVIEPEEVGPEGVWVRAPESLVKAWEESPTWEGVMEPVVRGIEYHSRTGWRPLRELVGERPTIPDEAKVDPNLVPEPDPFTPEDYAVVVGRAMENGAVSRAEFAEPHMHAAMEAASKRGELKRVGEGIYAPADQAAHDSRASRPSGATPANNPTGDILPDIVGPSEFYIKAVPVAEVRDRSAFDEAKTNTKAERIKLLAERGKLERDIQAIPQNKPTDHDRLKQGRDQRRTDLQRRMQQVEDRLAGLTTGREAYAVIEKKGSAEVARHSFPTRKAAEDYIQNKQLPKREAPKTPARVHSDLFNRANARMKKVVGPSALRLITGSYLKRAPHGTVAKGYFDAQQKVIALARDIYGLKDEAQLDAVLGTLNHELIHALRQLGKINNGEMRMLVNEAKRRRWVQDGSARPYTVFQRAEFLNRTEGPEVIEEEAVAEMFRVFAADPKARPAYKKLLDRIMEFFRKLAGFVNEADRYMARIDQGELATVAAEERAGGERMYSRTYNYDIFTSPLMLAVMDSSTKRASPAQWKATLIKAPGVKKDELEWSGVLDWLTALENGENPYDGTSLTDSTPSSVTKEDVLAWIQNEGPVIHEVILDDEANYGDDDEDLGGDTQYEGYSNPGGDNYREFVFQLPNKGRLHSNHRTFNGAHHGGDNVIAHARTKNRVDAEGNGVLFIEEVQSDWHQQGRNHGYAEKRATKEEIAEALRIEERTFEALMALSMRLAEPIARYYDIRAEQIKNQIAAYFDEAHTGGPSIYYLNGQLEEVMRRAKQLRGESETDAYAAVARWFSINWGNLSSAVLKDIPELEEGGPEWNRINLEWLEQRNYLAQLQGGGTGVPDAPFKSAWPALVMKRLIQIAAQEGADKIAWIKPDQYNGGQFSGEKGGWFYERNLPNITNDIIKRYGAKVERVMVPDLNGEPNLSPETMDAVDEYYRIRESINKVMQAIRSHGAEGGLERTKRRVVELREAAANPPEPRVFADDPSVIQKYLNLAHVLESAIPLWEQYETLGVQLAAAEERMKALKQGDVQKALEDSAQTQPGFKLTPELKAAVANPRSTIRTYSRSAMPSRMLSASPVGMRPPPGSPYAKAVLDRNAAKVQARMTVVSDAMSKGLFWFPREKRIQVMDRVAQRFQDVSFPVRRLIDNLRKSGASISEAQDVALEIDLMPGATQFEMEAVSKSLYAPAYKAVAEITNAKSILNQLDKVSPFARSWEAPMTDQQKLVMLLLYAQHAEERNKFIRDVRQRKNPDGSPMENGSGMTNEEAKLIRDTVAGSPSFQKVFSAAEQVRAIIHDTVQRRIRAGLAPDYKAERKTLQDQLNALDGALAGPGLTEAEKLALMKRRAETLSKINRIPDYQYYVPLRGRADVALEDDFDDRADEVGVPVDEMRTAGGFGYKVAGLEDKRAAGRRSFADDIFASVILQNTESIIRAHKNRVAQTFVRLIQDNPKAFPWASIIEKHDMPKRPTVGSDGRVVMRRASLSDPNNFTFVAKFDGRETLVEIKDGGLAEAMMGLSSVSDSLMGRFLGMLGWATTRMAKMSTAWNIDFLFSNPLRDIQTAALQAQQYDYGASGLILKEAPGILGGLIMGNKNTYAEYHRLQELGGFTGYLGMHTHGSVLEQITQEIRLQQSGWSNEKLMAHIWRKGGTPLRLLENWAEHAEAATRLAVFKSFVQRGYSEKRAAQIAKSLTTNFNRKGTAGPELNAIWMFANASIQGTNTFLQFALSPRGMAAISALTMLGVLQEAYYDDDEDYRLIPEYVKERNIIIMVPGVTEEMTGGKLTGRNFIKIPKPWGFNVPHEVGRQLIRGIRGRAEWGTVGAGVASSMMGAFNPVGTTNAFMALVPSTLRPVAEIATNRDWAGRQVAPPRREQAGKVPSQNRTEYVSDASVMIADALHTLGGGVGSYLPGIEVNPHHIDHLFGAYLGGLGRTIGRLGTIAQHVFDPAGQAAKGRELKLNDIPVARVFMGNVSDQSIVQSYQETTTPYLQIYKAMQEIEENGTPEALAQFSERYGEKLSLAETIAENERERIRLTRERRELQEDVSLSDIERAQLVSALKEEEKALMRASLQEISQGQ